MQEDILLDLPNPKTDYGRVDKDLTDVAYNTCYEDDIVGALNETTPTFEKLPVGCLTELSPIKNIRFNATTTEIFEVDDTVQNSQVIKKYFGF